MNKQLLLALAVLFSSTLFAAEDIGFGYIAGYKVGNFNLDQISVELAEGYSHDLRGCFGVIFINTEDMSPLRFQVMSEVIIAAHANNNKVRFHSHLDDSCNATFIAVEEEHS